MQKSRLFLLLLLLGTAFWGISFSFVKAGISQSSLLVFLCYKFALAAFVLVLVFLPHVTLVNRKTVLHGCLMGLPLLLANITQTMGLERTSVANTAFITGLDVLIIPLIKYFVFRRAVRWITWLSCSIALVGLAVIVDLKTMAVNAGDLWVMISACFFACYILAVGFAAGKADAAMSVVIALLLSSAGCAFATLFESNTEWWVDDKAFWQGIAFSGVLGTAYMYAVQSYAQHYISEEKVAMTYLFEPIFASAAAVLLLDEYLNLQTYVGAALIIGALVVSEIRWRKGREVGG